MKTISTGLIGYQMQRNISATLLGVSFLLISSTVMASSEAQPQTGTPQVINESSSNHSDGASSQPKSTTAVKRKVPKINYVGLTRKQVYEKLSAQKSPYIGYRTFDKSSTIDDGSKRFNTWKDLSQDSTFNNLKQWYVNTKTNKNGTIIKSYVLTFENGVVISQKVDTLNWPPTKAQCQEAALNTNANGTPKQDK